MLGGKNFSVPVTVVDDITADIILGIDFLRTENCIIDLGWKTLQLPSRKTLQSLHTDKQHVSLDKVQQGQLFVVLQQHRCGAPLRQALGIVEERIGYDIEFTRQTVPLSAKHLTGCQ